MKTESIQQIKTACADIRIFCSENNILSIGDKMLFAQGFIESFYRHSLRSNDIPLQTVIELFELGLNLSLKR